MPPSRRSFVRSGSAAILAALAGCGGQEPTESPSPTDTEPPTASPSPTQEATDAPGATGPAAVQEVTFAQEPGNVFYWVAPGERRISEQVFGTPDAPRFGTGLLKFRIQQARQLPEPLGSAVPKLLQDFPILVAMPDKIRRTSGGQFTSTTIKTPFGPKGVPTGGSFEVTLRDARPFDLPGPPGKTPDSAELSASFQDPAGNEYEVELDHVIQPPFPGYETGGGVIVDAWHHGTSGTGTPFMPRVYTYGAFWGLGNVAINGETAAKMHAMHLMTTQTVRDQDYNLATGEELPLTKGDTIGGQVHHTHMFVLPVKATPDGPVFQPVPTQFELPNGQNQPFIHAMWEQDTLVEHSFAAWSPANEGSTVQTATVKQDAGNVFYWVTPGPRRISRQVFGTPDNPRFGTELLKFRIEQAKQLPGPLSDTVPKLLQEFPTLVAMPEKIRETNADGTAYTKTNIMTPFGDDGVPTSGEFEVTFRDARPYDLPGPPGKTPDSADLTASFQDPAGHQYEVQFDHVIQPPIPGYETGGGVMIDAWHHGTTGTGTPFMPRVYTYGALWGVGNLVVDGEVTTKRHVIHLMTTQNVRDKDYKLALGEELPLAPADTIGGQVHHTHMFMLPVKATPEGPVFEPVKTKFELPNGKTQPFVHAMWEQDTLVVHPFADWSFGT